MMLVPVLLSYFFFMSQSLRLDEAQSLWQVSRGVTDIFTIIAADVHVPLYHLFLHFWIIYLGNTVPVARTLSMVLYLVSIPALYSLGKLAYGRSAGLFAAFLFSISPFMNWYGNEVRMYTLFTLFAILNQYFFIRLFKDRQEKNRDASDHVWVGYILTAVLGVFSHYFFFLILVAQLVFYFLHQSLFARGSLKRFAFAALVVCGAFLPWGWYVLHLGQAGFQEPALATPSSVNLFSAFSQFMFGFQNDNVNTFFLSLWPISVLFAFFILGRNQRMLPETEYFVTTILVSFAIAFFGSFIVAPIFVSRYLIFTVPSLYLLLASLLENFEPRVARLARYSFAAVMLVMLWVEIASPTTPTKENYALAAAYLNTHTTPQDVILLSAPFTVYPVQYYYRGASPIATLPNWNQYVYGPIPAFSESALGAQVASSTQNSQNVYLLLSYDQGYESKIKNYFDTHYQQLYTQNFSKDLNLYVYKLRYDTTLSAVATTL